MPDYSVEDYKGYGRITPNPASDGGVLFDNNTKRAADDAESLAASINAEATTREEEDGVIREDVSRIDFNLNVAIEQIGEKAPLYTADVYITPFDEDAFKEDVKVIASGEMAAEDSFQCQPILNKTFVKSVDFISKEG